MAKAKKSKRKQREKPTSPREKPNSPPAKRSKAHTYRSPPSCRADSSDSSDSSVSNDEASAPADDAMRDVHDAPVTVSPSLWVAISGLKKSYSKVEWKKELRPHFRGLKLEAVKTLCSRILMKFSDVALRDKFILAVEEHVDAPPGKSCLPDFLSLEDPKSLRVNVADENSNTGTMHGFALRLSSRVLIEATADDVLTELKEDGFPDVTVERMAPRKGKFKGTFKLVFTSKEDLLRARQGVTVFYERMKPGFWGSGAPALCWNCQLHGHPARNCPSKNAPKCGKCAGNHRTKACTSETERCVNCGGNHTAIDFRCKYARSVRDHDEARKLGIDAPPVPCPTARDPARSEPIPASPRPSRSRPTQPSVGPAMLLLFPRPKLMTRLINLKLREPPSIRPLRLDPSAKRRFTNTLLSL